MVAVTGYLGRDFLIFTQLGPEQGISEIIVCDNCNDMRHKRR
jgi:hypothetical protein